MTSGPSGSKENTWIALAIAVVAALGVPTSFVFFYSITQQNIWISISLVILAYLITILIGLFTGVIKAVSDVLVKGASETLVKLLGKRQKKEEEHQRQETRDKYRQPYLQYLVYNYRTLDVKGLSTQGTFALELERVFVDLSIAESSITNRKSNNDNPVPFELRQGGHGIWAYLNSSTVGNMVIIGAPGSGKTTLLKYIALALTNLKSKPDLHIPDKLPILLFLRDHAKTILDDPTISLPNIVRKSLDLLEEKAKAPEGWFEEHLGRGDFLVMLDGLDEVADSEARLMVIEWVEKQMALYGENRFILTSRPHGYRSNPINGVTLLEVRQFNRNQIASFVYNWYLATEIMRHQKIDPGVKMAARRGSVDLMRRIDAAPDIAELAVNPLLLTMIANVHQFRSSLPGRRVELYSEMCDVFLGKSEQARGLIVDLTPAQKQDILRPLAFAMMAYKTRELPLHKMIKIIEYPLRLVAPNMKGEDFIESIQNRSGILIERENGIYSFSHKTFQEYLTAVYMEKERSANELTKVVVDDWWHETIRLFCARNDATAIIQACLEQDPVPISTLVLAIECSEEALRVQPKIRHHLEQIINQDVESDDLQRRHVAAEAILTRRLKGFTRLDDDIYRDVSPITNAEFQLFVDGNAQYTPYHWLGRHFRSGSGKMAVGGVTEDAAVEFCRWLTKQQTNQQFQYRLPMAGEIQQAGIYWIKDKNGHINLSESKTLEMRFKDWLINRDGMPMMPSLNTSVQIPATLRVNPVLYVLVYELARALFPIIAVDIRLARVIGKIFNLDLDNPRDLDFAHSGKLPRIIVKELSFDAIDPLEFCSAVAGGRFFVKHGTDSNRTQRIYAALDNLAREPNLQSLANLKKQVEIDSLSAVERKLINIIELIVCLDEHRNGNFDALPMLRGDETTRRRFRKDFLTWDNQFGVVFAPLQHGDINTYLEVYAILALHEKLCSGELQANEILWIIRDKAPKSMAKQRKTLTKKY